MSKLTPHIPSIDFPTIPRMPSHEEVARRQYEGNNIARSMAQRIVAEVRAFERDLSPEQETAFSVVTNSGFEQIIVLALSVSAPDILRFEGEDADGNSVALIQHVSQANVLLRAIAKRQEVARRIGFDIPAA